MARNNGEFEFKIISRIGRLAKYQTGWSKELNIVAWNGGAPKFDIRDWDPDHEHMSKGITLHEGEAKNLVEHLSRCFGMKMVSVDMPEPAVSAAEPAETAPESAVTELEPVAEQDSASPWDINCEENDDIGTEEDEAEAGSETDSEDGAHEAA